MMARSRAEDAAKWGWALLIWGAPWSHAAMTLGTVWVTLCALLVLKKRDTPSMSSAPLLWLLGLFAWGWLSLLWSDNLDWGLQLASIQVTLLALAFSWHAVPRPNLTAKWIFQSAALAMAGALAWGAWRVGQGEALAGRDWTPWISHIRLAMLAALGWVWAAHQSKTSLFSLAPFGPSSRRSRARSRAPFCGPGLDLGAVGSAFYPRGEACWQAPQRDHLALAGGMACGFGRCPSPFLRRNFPRSPRRAMPTPTILSGWCPRVDIASTSSCAPWNGKMPGPKSATSPCSNPTRPASRSAIGCPDT